MEKRWDFSRPEKNRVIKWLFLLFTLFIIIFGVWVGLGRDLPWLVIGSLVLGAADLFIYLTVHPVSIIALHEHHITVNKKSFPLAALQRISLSRGKLLFQIGHSKSHYVYTPGIGTDRMLDEISEILPEISNVTIEDNREKK
ncbi:MAG TPA: hypothetical protein PLJ93_02490 [Candidatus Mcinerneyibacteriales bacterium]|nr:hypothetical protein [Candidatus Mcinerneyibacteriales bacterium]